MEEREIEGLRAQLLELNKKIKLVSSENVIPLETITH